MRTRSPFSEFFLKAKIRSGTLAIAREVRLVGVSRIGPQTAGVETPVHTGSLSFPHGSRRFGAAEGWRQVWSVNRRWPLASSIVYSSRQRH